MDPTTVCCPNPVCPARGHGSQGPISIHARSETRFICTQGRKTFAATTGTVFSRVRTSTARVVTVVTWLAHGCPVQAIVAACGVDERTVAAWAARAGRQGQAVQEHLVEHPRDVGHGQAAEIRGKTPGGLGWMALSLMVKPRWWLAGEVRGPRDLLLIRGLLEPVHRGALQRPLLCGTDGLSSYIRAMRAPCRDPVQTGRPGRPRLSPWRHVCIAQVVKREARRRVVDVARRLVDGRPARGATRRRRSQGDGVINTADSERLNATCRERLASLTRRGRALARRTRTWQSGMSVIGTVDHLCTPHARLGLGRSLAGIPGVERTPALAAGLTDQCWTVRELLSFHVPPPAGYHPSRAGVAHGPCKL
jgi:transposase-like protein